MELMSKNELNGKSEKKAKDIVFLIMYIIYIPKNRRPFGLLAVRLYLGVMTTFFNLF